MALLVDLVTDLRTALTTGNGAPFATSTAFYAFDPEESLKNPPSDQFAVIQPTGLDVRQRTFGTGGGGVNLIYTWKCCLWLFVRLATDEAHRDDSYLLDATNGSIALADSVVSLLQDYTSGQGFGYELDSIEWPRRDRPTSGWAATKLYYHTDLASRSA